LFSHGFTAIIAHWEARGKGQEAAGKMEAKEPEFFSSKSPK
jgi:hypothetical protein